jgi:hypothetical protein
LYNDIIDQTRAESYVNKGRKDIDLEEHKKLLEHKNITKKGGDWNVFAMTSISEGCDFVTELLEKYLDDIRVRNRDEELNLDLPRAVILRRQIKL